MAWSVGVFPLNTAGLLVAELDVLLPANPHWSIYDTPAAGIRVYECIDVAAVCLFYVYIDNTAAAVGVVQLWEGWNAGAHVGVGVSLTFIGTSVSLKMTYGAGGYGISVRDHCFIWQDYVGAGRGWYIGQPRRKDTSLNIVVYCGSGGTPGANALGLPGSVVTTAWVSLFDELGNKSALAFSMYSAGSYAIVKTILGEIELRETPLTNTVTQFILGELEGVASYGAATIAGIVNGDTCLMPGGIIWGALYNSYLTFVERA
ncbi:MAG: hypothetical protein MUP81_01900 [Dehalococcoidia bacterium]|nr:hypothetical protein [Dehalococcoidia bacterium]